MPPTAAQSGRVAVLTRGSGPGDRTLAAPAGVRHHRTESDRRGGPSRAAQRPAAQLPSRCRRRSARARPTGIVTKRSTAAVAITHRSGSVGVTIRSSGRGPAVCAVRNGWLPAWSRFAKDYSPRIRPAFISMPITGFVPEQRAKSVEYELASGTPLWSDRPGC